MTSPSTPSQTRKLARDATMYPGYYASNPGSLIFCSHHSMGGDQSRSYRTEEQKHGTSINVVPGEEMEIPYNYTSFSVGRPNSTNSKKFPQKQEIVVVRSDPSVSSTSTGSDPVLQRLEEIPVVFPIIRSSVNMLGYRDLEDFEKLDHRHVLLLCLRYQRHMKECAEAVSFDQAALTRRLKDLDLISSAAVHDVTRMHHHVTRMSAHLQSDMRRLQMAVEKAETAIQRCVPLMRRLNNVLPEDERLECFELVPEIEGHVPESDGETDDCSKTE